MEPFKYVYVVAPSKQPWLQVFEGPAGCLTRFIPSSIHSIRLATAS